MPQTDLSFRYVPSSSLRSSAAGLIVVERTSTKTHSDAPCFFTVSAEPWTVEDLLHEDSITDKVPLQRLQLLGMNPTSPSVNLKVFSSQTWIISRSLLSSTGQSKELRDLLCNPHLRQLLRSVDGADNKYDAMKAAMQEPLFVEFSDRCLKIADDEAKTSDAYDL